MIIETINKIYMRSKKYVYLAKQTAIKNLNKIQKLETVTLTLRFRFRYVFKCESEYICERISTEKKIVII